MSRTPEEIAADIIFSNPLLDWSDPEFPAFYAPESPAHLVAMGVRAGIAEAQAEPQFAPEGEPDEYRDAWQTIGGIAALDGVDYWPEDEDGDLRIDGPSEEVRVGGITRDQARHILASLSEQSREAGR